LLDCVSKCAPYGFCSCRFFLDWIHFLAVYHNRWLNEHEFDFKSRLVLFDGFAPQRVAYTRTSREIMYLCKDRAVETFCELWCTVISLRGLLVVLRVVGCWDYNEYFIYVLCMQWYSSQVHSVFSPRPLMSSVESSSDLKVMVQMWIKWAFSDMCYVGVPYFLE